MVGLAGVVCLNPLAKVLEVTRQIVGVCVVGKIIKGIGDGCTFCGTEVSESPERKLPHGLRPQVELDVAYEPSRLGDLEIAVRPALRYWPAEWVGIGISAGIWVAGPEIETSAIRLDVVGHAME